MITAWAIGIRNALSGAVNYFGADEYGEVIGTPNSTEALFLATKQDADNLRAVLEKHGDDGLKMAALGDGREWAPLASESFQIGPSVSATASERERFENWLRSEFGDRFNEEVLAKDEDQNYSDYSVQCRWEGWQARAPIAVAE